MLKIALAQLNYCVGDVKGNTQKMLIATQQAKQQKAAMIVFSELAITAYPPEDLLFNENLRDEVKEALLLLQAASRDCAIVVGHPLWEGRRCYNAASVFYQEKLLACYKKQCLPNYGVFDELRYFEAGDAVCVVEIEGLKTGLVICEDIWREEAVKRTVEAGAQWVIAINASPYEQGKCAKREALLTKLAKKNAVSIAYVNQVGGQDELVFDGASFAVNRSGKLLFQAPVAEEVLSYVNVSPDGEMSAVEPVFLKESEVAQRYQLLSLALHDYVIKNGFKRVFLGVSGGIDSALVLALAVDALGADKVTAVVMPSRYTAAISFEDAYALVKALKVRMEELSIEPAVESINASLAPLFIGRAEDVTEKNIQARVRGLFLMALANKFNGLVLTTSNKSELAVGYSTLYGDMAGAFDVIKDIYKTEVVALAQYRNSIKPVIPERIINRPPSAELAFDQVDQDDLPPYALLDAVLFEMIEGHQSVREVLALGYDGVLVQRIAKLLKMSEYKRRQSPLGPKMSSCAFGKDWRYPVTRK